MINSLSNTDDAIKHMINLFTKPNDFIKQINFLNKTNDLGDGSNEDRGAAPPPKARPQPKAAPPPKAAAPPPNSMPRQLEPGEAGYLLQITRAAVREAQEYYSSSSSSIPRAAVRDGTALHDGHDSDSGNLRGRSGEHGGDGSRGGDGHAGQAGIGGSSSSKDRGAALPGGLYSGRSGEHGGDGSRAERTIYTSMLDSDSDEQAGVGGDGSSKDRGEALHGGQGSDRGSKDRGEALHGGTSQYPTSLDDTIFASYRAVLAAGQAPTTPVAHPVGTHGAYKSTGAAQRREASRRRGLAAGTKNPYTKQAQHATKQLRKVKRDGATQDVCIYQQVKLENMVAKRMTWDAENRGHIKSKICCVCVCFFCVFLFFCFSCLCVVFVCFFVFFCFLYFFWFLLGFYVFVFCFLFLCYKRQIQVKLLI